MTSITDGLSPAEQESLKASTFQRLHPRVYLERFLAENIRPDGRACDAWRDVSANVGALCSRRFFARIQISIHPQAQYQRRTAPPSFVWGTRPLSVVSKPKLQNQSSTVNEKGSSVRRYLSLLTHPLSSCINPPVPNLDLPAMCSPKFKPGPPTEEAQVLSDRLNEALLASVALLSFPWIVRSS